jgi:hypothetical protein
VLRQAHGLVRFPGVGPDDGPAAVAATGCFRSPVLMPERRTIEQPRAGGPAVRALACSVADAVETVAPALRGTRGGGGRGGQRARELLS